MGKFAALLAVVMLAIAAVAVLAGIAVHGLHQKPVPVVVALGGYIDPDGR